jgi:hypothetical protein
LFRAGLAFVTTDGPALRGGAKRAGPLAAARLRAGLIAAANRSAHTILIEGVSEKNADAEKHR